MKRTQLMMLAVLALISTLSTVAAAASIGSLAAAIDDLMSNYAALGSFSGAILVADRDGIVIEKAYGLANREWDIPNTTDTRFRIGSLSKQFTAALVMILCEEGRLSLDAKLGDVLPWYRQDTGQAVTIRQLLNHTSGLDQSGVMRMIMEAPTKRISLREEVLDYCSADFEWQPGSRFGYNNAGYLILSAVVEEVGGKSWQEIFAEKILEPVGMRNTALGDSRLILPQRADGYDRTAEGLRKPPFVDPLLASGAGGVISTVGDLYLWDKALYTDAILSSEAREQMFTPGPGPYGFGWYVIDLPVGPGGAERKVIGHPGQGDGFHSMLWRIPEDHATVILINNLGMTDLDSMAEGILGILHGTPARISVGEVLRDAIDTKGTVAARQIYFRLKEGDSGLYDFGVDALDRLGYLLLRRGSEDEAVAVFELNAEMFPESANAFDSLGEAYEQIGELERAVEYYREALRIEPGFGHAEERLKVLVEE